MMMLMLISAADETTQHVNIVIGSTMSDQPRAHNNRAVQHTGKTDIKNTHTCNEALNAVIKHDGTAAAYSASWLAVCSAVLRTMAAAAHAQAKCSLLSMLGEWGSST